MKINKHTKVKQLFGKQIKQIIGLVEGSRIVVFTFYDDTTLTLCNGEGYYGGNSVDATIAQVDGVVTRHIDQTLLGFDIKENETVHGTAVFYTIKTTKGYLDFRWEITSNGYYSEEVDTHIKGLV